MNLFEVDKRRSDWIEGRSITLENGQSWMFPLPMMCLILSLDPAKDPMVGNEDQDDNRRFSGKFWELQDSVRKSIATESNNPTHLSIAQKVFPLAANVIRRNYDLTDEELGQLFKVRPDARNAEMWIDVMNLTLGIGPKPDPAG